MAEPDFRLKVGADVAASVNQFKQDLQDIVKQLESNPPKIRVDIDDRSVTNAVKKMQTAFESMTPSSGAETALQRQINILTGVSRAGDEVKHTANDMKAALAEYDREVKAANDYLAELAKREKEAANQASATETPLQKQINALTGVSRANDEVKHTANDMKAALAEYDREQKASTQAAKAQTQATKEQAQAADSASAEMHELGDAIEDASTKTSKFGASMQELGQYMLRFVSLQQVISQIENLVKTSVELDSSFTQLQIVTKESDGVMREFGNTAADIATRVGASIADVVDSATTFARLGYSLSESATLSEFTTMLQNVGDIDVSSAQNAITSIVKAFGDEIDISNIESVMDKLVVVGKVVAQRRSNASQEIGYIGQRRFGI